MILPEEAPQYRGYRVPSARWRAWDYGAAGWYFVTPARAGARRISER